MQALQESSFGNSVRYSTLLPQSVTNMWPKFLSSQLAKPEGYCLFGVLTIQEGECLGVWDSVGSYRVVRGPSRTWLLNSSYTYMKHWCADEHQYLVIQHKDGSKEHKRGPVALFEDPLHHVSIKRLDAVTVDAFQVIVVYTEHGDGKVVRSVIRGPAVFVPLVNQWLHVFSWHGTAKNGDRGDKVPNALVFTKLATIPDQLYYNAHGVRTADDASLTIKVMVFFVLEDLEKMLNSTHDPIADFINSLIADLMNFAARLTYEDFISAAQQLCDLETFPVLMARASDIGYKVSKVVYRGYTASTALQELCDRAIRTRLELRLKQEQEEQALKLQDLQLERSVARGAEERQQEATRAAHALQLKAAEAQAQLARDRTQREQSMALEDASTRARQSRQEVASESALRYLAGLKQLGVDLTPTMLAACEPKPDRVLQLIGMPQQAALHARLDD